MTITRRMMSSDSTVQAEKPTTESGFKCGRTLNTLNDKNGNCDMSEKKTDDCRIRKSGSDNWSSDRSEVRVVGSSEVTGSLATSREATPLHPSKSEGVANEALMVIPQTTCQVPQSEEARKVAKKLFESFSNRISKGSSIVTKTFTLEKLIMTVENYLRHCQHQQFPQISPKNSGVATPLADSISSGLADPSSKDTYTIYSLCCDPNFLLLAYAKLRERGDVAMGIDNVPTQNMTLGGIRKLGMELWSHTYQPNPVRRTFLPKPDGGQRPYGIPSTKDKVVQMALKMLLEPIYEQQFLDCSYGFRPKRNCHSALHHIDTKWRRTTWFIEADLVKAFDRINHKRLRQLIRQRVPEGPTLDLIDKLLKAGYIDFPNLSNSEMKSEKGTPQGSILSPILCNIYLHELDKFIQEQLIPKWNVKRQDKVSTKWKESSRVTGEQWEPVYQAMKKAAPLVRSKDIRKSMHQVMKMDIIHKDVPYYEIDPNHRKLLYVRYADDFLLGFVGPKKDAWRVLQEIAAFLEMDLYLNLHPDKSGIAHHEDGVLFLGYKLIGNYEGKYQYNEDQKQRTRSNKIKFRVPIKQLLKKYAEKGLITIAKKGNNTKYVGRRADKFLMLPSDLEVVKRFNAIAKGVAEYYSGVSNPSSLNEFWYLLKRSLALTLAHRHKLRTAKSALQKWGENLTVKQKKLNGEIVELSWKTPQMTRQSWKPGTAIQGYLEESILKALESAGPALPKTLGAVVRAAELKCSIPNCPNKAEQWHHIKHRKRLKLTGRMKQIQELSAKQIPICKAHHLQIHKGEYDGPSLRKLPGYTIGSIQDEFPKESD